MQSTDSVPSTLLSGDNCVDSTRIRAFLRLSRIATDDTIKTHLNEIKQSQCDGYFRDQIVPQWNARAKVIDYCRQYSETLKQEINRSSTPESVAAGDEKFDLRLDPYAVKAYEQSKEAKYAKIDTIDNWIANEEQIESIVKDQTQSTFNDKCYYKDWLQYFDQLKRSS